MAYSIYSPEKEDISFIDAKSILWNFGYWKLSEIQFLSILKDNKIDESKRKISYKELLSIVSKKYAHDGTLSTAKSIFSIFDKGTGAASFESIFKSLSENLEISVTETEVRNIFSQELDLDQLTFDDFMSLLNY